MIITATMSKLKEIYVKGTTATSVDNYMYLSQSREMIGWDKYHNNDVLLSSQHDNNQLIAENFKLKELVEEMSTKIEIAISDLISLDPEQALIQLESIPTLKKYLT